MAEPIENQKRVESLEKHFGDFAVEMKNALEKQDAELKARGASTEETGKLVAMLNTRFDAISAEMTGIKEQTAKLEKESQRMDLSGDDDDLQSLGELVCK